MKILFAGPLPPFQGGAADVNRDLVHGLAQRGHGVRAIAPVTSQDLAGAAAFARELALVPIRWFEQGSYVILHAKSPAEIIAAMEDEIAQFAHALAVECVGKPDVIICGRESAAVALSRLEQFREIPALVIAHGKGLQDAAQKNWPPELQSQILQGYQRCGHIVTVARHLNPYAETLGFEAVSTIGNIADPERFFPAPKDEMLLERWQIAADDIVVGHLSNLGPVKRPLDIVEAAALATKKRPNLLFLIVGADRLQKRMESRVKELGLTERFRFAGWIERNEAPRYINAMDMVVMPSEMEARSLVYLETQACGRVLIASDIAAAREVIEDGVSGLLFPMGSHEALAEKILEAAADPVLRAKIGAKARAQAETSNMAGWLNAYENLLAGLIREAGPA